MKNQSKTITLKGSEEFEQLALQSNRPVAVDFWADWCGPCKAMGPILENAAESVNGQADIAKINVDENPELAARYGIRSIPTILYFKNGELKNRSVGLVSQSEIIRQLAELN